MELNKEIVKAQTTNVHNMVQRIKDQASSNPVFAAACRIFASRERARHQLTVRTLNRSFEAAGYQYPAIESVNVILFLAEIGVGKIQYDSKGTVLGLTDIRITLQSIGECASAGLEIGVKKFKPQRRFQKLSKPEVVDKLVEKVTAPKVKTQEAMYISINGKQLAILDPSSVTPEALAEFILNQK